MTASCVFTTTVALLVTCSWAWTTHLGDPTFEATEVYLSKFLGLLNKGEECYSNLHEPFFCRKYWHSKAISHEPYISRNATEHLHNLNELFVSVHCFALTLRSHPDSGGQRGAVLGQGECGVG